MASAWIPSGNDQARLTNQLRLAIQNLTQAAANIEALSNIMSQMVSNGSDYSVVETYFSIPTGQGQNVVPIVGTANTSLQATQIQGLLQRMG